MIHDRIRILVSVAEKVLSFGQLPIGVAFVKATSDCKVPQYYEELWLKTTATRAVHLGRVDDMKFNFSTPVCEAILDVEFVIPPKPVIIENDDVLEECRHPRVDGSGVCEDCGWIVGE